MSTPRTRLFAVAAPLALLAVAACESESPTDALSLAPGNVQMETADLLLTETPDNVVVWNNIFKLCKVGPAGSTATFRIVEVRFPGTPEESTSERLVQVAPGTCKVVARNSDDPLIQVSELPQAGFQVDSIEVHTIGVLKEEEFGAVVEYATDYILENTNYVEEIIGRTVNGVYPHYSHVGAVAIFYNGPETPDVTPGSEGCTPGYWKQPHHFDSWVGYAPDQQFSSVFEDAFPGMTLVEVASQGGGGINALGRHVVAALLSAASSIDYGMEPAHVIAAFNEVYPGSKSDYDELKNELAGRNERNCPLN